MNKPSMFFTISTAATGVLSLASCAEPKQSVPADDDEKTDQRTHIILLMTDQQRGDALGYAGNTVVSSPHIDALARDGVYFPNGYSSTPSSTPARAGLLTGMSPWGHGLLGYGTISPTYRYEMPRMMKEAGYYTLGIGKMHWSPQRNLHGFHRTILDESGRVEDAGFVSDYRRWFAEVAPGLDPDATGIGWNAHAAKAYVLPEHLHPTRWTGDVAVEAIENYDDERPLFLKVSFARPHSPYDPPQRYLDLYAGVDVPAPAHGEWSRAIGANVTNPAANPNAWYGNFGDEYAKTSIRHYYAAITFIDDQIGRIIDALKAKGMYENALICFVSDHGDMLGDHNHWRKTYAYEGSSRVPYIVKFPQGVMTAAAEGQSLEQPVELRDLLPTFIDIAGGEVPSGMEGQSLRKLVVSNNPAWRRWIDLEHAECYTPDNYWCALTDGKIKYIWFFRTGVEQLFDLQTDPRETTELSADPAYAARLEALRAAMVDHLSLRGTGWVQDGKLVRRTSSQLKSPNYPT